MKKISQPHFNSSHDLKINDNLNPQQNQTKCKICFQQTLPLVTLCDCTGSIAYVHEDCILDWIALKMQKSQVIQIPKCEICKIAYSAAMKVGSKKIDNSLLYQKLQSATKKNCLTFVCSIIGFIVAVLTILISIFNLFLGNSLILESAWSVFFSAFKTVFIDFTFPCVFIEVCIRYFKKNWKAVEECKVQLVEVTLLPKKILKS